MNADNFIASAVEAVPSQPLYHDIQGLLVNGYRGYNFIRFLIFTIPKANIFAVRKFCGDLIPGTPGSLLTVTPATRWLSDIERPPYRLNLGLTNSGLKKLMTSPTNMKPTNYEIVFNKSYQLMNRFAVGPANPNTAQRVGDTGPSDPNNWWQGEGWQLSEQDRTTTDLDLLISLYAPTPEERDAWHGRLMEMIGRESAVLAFQQDSDPLDPVGQKIHFGYRDGISQPRIAGFSETDPDQDDRPSVDSWRFIINLIAGDSSSPPTYHAHPLLNNGSFGAFRMLYQDVKAFEKFINQNGAAEAEHIAAKMCGRWRDGTPIEVAPSQPLNKRLRGRSLRHEYNLNNFDYVGTSAHQEPKPAPLGNPDYGQACPYAGHVRRANPRDDPSVRGNTDPLSGNLLLATRNRVLRRARPYGLPYDPTDEATRDGQRGLIGLFIGADLGAQFEFLMQQWITNGNFSTKDGSSNKSGYDPLFGPPPEAVAPGTTEFSYCSGDPTKPSDYRTLPGLPQLVVTRGALYVFLPSISALRNLANGTIPALPH
jgi:deferrochelatase/peroxidase EfeB